MTEISLIVAILTFLLGFYIGLRMDKKPIKQVKPKIKLVEENSEIQNFFSYDGTEQL